MSKQKKTDEELLQEYEERQKKYEERVSKVKARIAKNEHERQFKIYKNVYDAMHAWLTHNNITDDMILNMDAKAELRHRIFHNNQNQQ